MALDGKTRRALMVRGLLHKEPMARCNTHCTGDIHATLWRCRYADMAEAKIALQDEFYLEDIPLEVVELRPAYEYEEWAQAISPRGELVRHSNEMRYAYSVLVRYDGESAAYPAE